MAKAELEKQHAFSLELRDIMRLRATGEKPVAYVRTYGCQQNVADGEKIKGMLSEMGFVFTENKEEADFILFNTCAIREHAEDRVFGNVGALKNLKRKKPSLIIALCGCMMEQEHVAEKIKKSFPFVNIVFGTHVIHKFPEIVHTNIVESKRVFIRGQEQKEIIEGLPVQRDGDLRAWLTIMYGCDNFCTYCVVPHVRGREKSRKPEEIVKEFKELVALGYKEITLLGQNVNSYGKGLGDDVNFAKLLQMLDNVEGDYVIRFMTSHPKDASKELFEIMSKSKHIPHHVHLPFQSGNNKVLGEMNRRYTKEKYLGLINTAKELMPDITFTSDVIVGFPGETYEEFCDTLTLIKEVEFMSLFTFIFSPREGTPAIKMQDPIPHSEKTKWFAELLKVQEEISAKNCQKAIGQKQKVLAEELNPKTGLLEGRNLSNVVVSFSGDESLIGQFCTVEITEARNWILKGKQI